MVLTETQKNLLIGTLLGEGNLQTQTNGNTWRYRSIHKAAHQPYIFHKYEILKNFCKSPPNYSSIVDSRTKKTYNRFFFQTEVFDDLKYYGNLFYKQQADNSFKKQVPKNIKDLLTAESLAYWYMDDGALKWRGKSNAVRICTDSFTNSEICILKKALEEKFFLKISLQKKDSIERLCILEESYPILKNILVPFLIPSMYYKFPDGEKGVFDGQDISNNIINRLDIPNNENPLF